MKYSIEIGEKGEFLSLVYEGKQFIKKPLPLFQFRLREGNYTQVKTSDEAEEIKITRSDTKTHITYVFKDVTFYATLDFKDRIEAALSFENNTGMYVEWVDFPQIAVPRDLVKDGGSGRLVLDVNEGLLLEDLSEKEGFLPYAYRDIEYPSKGLNFMFPAVVQSQFFAYYDDTAGIYVAAEDSGRSIKGIDFVPMFDAIKLQMRLYTGVMNDVKEFAFPFNTVIDFFCGDWYDAANLYRNWFEKNLPDGLIPVSENEDLPEWYHDSPLVVTYPVQGIHDMDEAVPNKLFPYNNALPFIDEIADSTDSRIMTVLMHWEGTAPWAPPYVWPPLGSEKMLSEFCAALHSKNHILGVYCSGLGYTIHSNINDYNMQSEYEQKGLEKYMCAAPDGTVVSEICQKQRKSYDMCISQEFTKDVICEQAEKMAGSGLDYIQILDQNHGGTPYFCYSDRHNHPAVPGKWMVEGMTDLLKRLKERVGKSVLLGCESAAAEAYIPYLNMSDNRFNINYAVGQPIPLYAYIYHRYLHNFSGNSVSSLKYVDIRKSPECYLLRTAHSFLAGDLMTLVINQNGEIVWNWGERDFSYLPQRQSVLDFVKTATAYRRGAGKKFLVCGEMIKPCKTESESVPMYKPQSDFVTYYPSVLTTAWRADDGSKAQFLANYCEGDKTCKIDLTDTCGAKVIDENGKTVNTLSSAVHSIKIPKNSVIMLLLQ